MTPLGFHVTLRLEGDRNLTPDTASRRLFARTVLTVARPFQLLAFRWVDTHGHLETMGSRAEAGEVTRRIEIALQLALQPGGRFVSAQFKPMMDLSHVKSTFFYVQGQQQHHGVLVDRFHDGSNGPDLIGARTIGAWTAVVVKQHLSRVTRADILTALGLADPAAFHPEPFGLAEAGAAAIGAADLTGLDAESRAARCAIAPSWTGRRECLPMLCRSPRALCGVCVRTFPTRRSSGPSASSSRCVRLGRASAPRRMIHPAAP